LELLPVKADPAARKNKDNSHRTSGRKDRLLQEIGRKERNYPNEKGSGRQYKKKNRKNINNKKRMSVMKRRQGAT
jgi:hypothetical protein